MDRGVEWFRDRALWLEPTETPQPGDLVFFDWDADGSAEHVGAVLSLTGDELLTLEGNSGGEVRTCAYAHSSAWILGYGVLPVE